MHFMDVKKLRKHSGLVIYTYLNSDKFNAVNRYKKVDTKGYHFCMKGYRVGPLGGASPCKTLLSYSQGLHYMKLSK